MNSTILVIGGGPVGVCCAYSLARAGAAVTLMEREDAICPSASAAHGNCGLIAPSEAVPLAAPAEGADAGAPLAAAIRAHRAAWKGRVILGVPADQALLRVLALPSADPAELRSMAELQLDKFSPFPAEHMLTAVEVLAQGDGASRVIVAAARRELLEARGAPVIAAGGLPDALDVELLGWWHHLVAAGRGAAPEGEVLLLLPADGADLIAAREGQPALFRSFGGAAETADGLSSADLLEEINYTLIALEAEWGAAKPRFAVWRAEHVAPAWEEALQQLPGGPAETHALSELPPLTEGLARRAAQPAGRQLDLAPPEWNATRRQRGTQRRITLAAGVLTSAWVLGLAVLLVGNQVQRHRVAQLKVTLARLEKPAEQVRGQLEQVQTLEQYTDHSRSALEVLREISQLLPPSGIRLISFIYRKNNSVVLRGEADAATMIYGFQHDLTQSKLFVTVKAEGVTDVKSATGVKRTQFGLTLSLAGGPA